MRSERSSRQLRETGECGRIRRVNGTEQDQTSDRRAEGVDGQCRSLDTAIQGSGRNAIELAL